MIDAYLNEALAERAEYNARGLTESGYCRGYIDAMRAAHRVVREYDEQRGTHHDD